MNIRITRLIDEAQSSATLRLEGVMSREAAELLAADCAELQAQGIAQITLDVTGLTFIDAESAAVICRLRRATGAQLTGCRLFTREVIETVETN